MELEMAERHGLLSQFPVNHEATKVTWIFVLFVSS
jgi:hypothetical protein